MIIAEMRSAHVPMEVLGLHVERKRVGDQRIERGRNLAHGVGRKIGRCVEPRRRGARFELSYLVGHGNTSCFWRVIKKLRGACRRLDARQTRGDGTRFHVATGRHDPKRPRHDSHKRYYGIYFIRQRKARESGTSHGSRGKNPQKEWRGVAYQPGKGSSGKGRCRRRASRSSHQRTVVGERRVIAERSVQSRKSISSRVIRPSVTAFMVARGKTRRGTSISVEVAPSQALWWRPRGSAADFCKI